MTYKELHQENLEYMRLNGWVHGYISDQERQAYMPCNMAVIKYSEIVPFLLKTTSAADRFYDLYSTVAAQDIIFGSFCNDGTIKRQPITVRFLKLEEYGDLDARAAFLMIAKDTVQKRLEASIELLTKKEEELKAIKKAVSDAKDLLSFIDSEITK